MHVLDRRIDNFHTTRAGGEVLSNSYVDSSNLPRYSRRVVVWTPTTLGYPTPNRFGAGIDLFEQSSLLNVPRSTRRAPKTSTRAPRQRLYAREHKPMCCTGIGRAEERWDVLNVC
jgi:hypothetical protein